MLAVFFYRGGISGFALSMASNALLSRDTTTADQWLTIAQRLSGSKSQVEYLLAKKTRMDRSFIDMTSHLKAALKQGVDPDLLEKEQVLANVSLARLILCRNLE